MGRTGAETPGSEPVSPEERANVLQAARTVVERIVQVVAVLERDLGLTERDGRKSG